MPVYEVTPAETPDDERKAYELFYRCFGPCYFEAQQVFDLTRKYDTTMTRQNLFVIKNEKNDVIAAARTVRRSLNIHQDQFSIGGIATTVVHPKYRGKGLFDRLTTSVLEEMNRLRLDLALVFARRAIDTIYTRHGFWGTPVERLFTVTHIPPVKENSLVFRKIKPSDIPFLTSVYHDVYSRLPVCLGRPDYLWASKIHNPALQQRQVCYICRYKDDENPVGYVIAEPGRGIIETCAHTDNPGIYRSMFFSSNSPCHDAAMTGLALPLDHPAIKELRTEPHSLFTRHPHDGGNILKILDCTNQNTRIMQMLKNELDKRDVVLPGKPRKVPPHVWSRILTAALFGYGIAETESALKIRAESGWYDLKPVDFIFNSLDDF